MWYLRRMEIRGFWCHYTFYRDHPPKLPFLTDKLMSEPPCFSAHGEEWELNYWVSWLRTHTSEPAPGLSPKSPFLETSSLGGNNLDPHSQWVCPGPVCFCPVSSAERVVSKTSFACVVCLRCLPSCCGVSLGSSCQDS